MQPAKIPVEVEIIGSGTRKSITWTAVGYTVGSLLAGPVGGVIGAISQGNEQKYTLRIKFDDNSQKLIDCDKNKANLELILWAWRIQNKKSESDYVTFGVDFDSLKRGNIISNAWLDNYLGLHKDKNSPELPENKQLGELWQTLQLELKLTKFYQGELRRYFLEQRKESILVEHGRRGFKIPPKHNWTFTIVLLSIFAVFFGYVGYINVTKPPQQSGQG
jgi:hypothetical protein